MYTSSGFVSPVHPLLLHFLLLHSLRAEARPVEKKIQNKGNVCAESGCVECFGLGSCRIRAWRSMCQWSFLCLYKFPLLIILTLSLASFSNIILRCNAGKLEAGNCNDNVTPLILLPQLSFLEHSVTSV